MEGVEDKHEPVMKERAEAKEKKQKVPFFKLFAFADGWDYTLMVLGTVAACVHGACMPVLYLFLGKMIHVMGEAFFFPASVSHRVGKYSLDFVYVGVVAQFAAWMEVAFWMHTGERQAARMRMAYLRSLLSQDIGLFDTQASTADAIAAITSDIIVVQDAISEKVGNFMHFMSRFIVGFVVGFVRIWQISLVTFSIVPLIAAAGGMYAYIATGLVSRMRKSYVEAGEVAEEVIGNVRTVQAFVGEEKAIGSYREALLKTYRYGKKGGLAKGLGLGTVHSVIFSSWALLIWFTSIVLHKGIADGGDAFSTMINVMVAGVALGQAAPNISTFLKARVAAYPIFEMIERSRLKEATPKTGKTLSRVEGHIQFSNVCFSYPSRPDALIFDELNLDVPSGKIVAIVGESGSGKSSVISLVERFYEPLSGAILLDGHNIKDLELKWLRQQIGLVNQEPALFATSIRENMLYGKVDATIDEITRAAEVSEALDFINNLPDRYETQVGERGIQLSGGQKQRIAISRVVLKNPRILLLDEATSALDAESEKSIQQALNRVMVGRTTIVVAHRLSTIRNANMIAVMQGGKIVETGTHDELMQNVQSAYVSLIQLQEAAASEEQSLHATIERTPSMASSRRMSGRMSSFRSSFHSDKDASEYVPEINEPRKLELASMRRLYSMAGPDWIFGVCGAICAFGAGAQTPLVALGITQALVSYYMDWETTQNEVKKISLLFCGGATLTLIFYTFEHFSFSIVGERLTLRIRERMFRGILQNEIGWFDDTSNTSSMLSARLETDATLLRMVVVDLSLSLLQSIGMMATAVIISFIFNWRMTLVLLAMCPVLLTGSIGEYCFMRGYGGNLSKAYLKANMLAAEAVSNIRTIAAFSSEDKVVEFYGAQLEEPSKSSFRRGQISGVLYGLSQCSFFCSSGLILWFGSVLMGKGLASFNGVIKPFVVITLTSLVMGETLALVPDIGKGNQMAASVFELIDRKTEVDGDVGDDVDRVVGLIEMRNVEFRYPSRPDIVIFKDLDLKVKAGKSMALVGTSGSGKSSVLSLILRFYDPTAGKVMVDGKDIRKLRLKSLRKHIGLVQQEPALFATTIYENISYGKDDPTEAEVIEAAKLANAHSFISALPEGYLTKVGERGVQLSGGQKQRVAIARAVIRNPAIFLLDEATSALDVESEHVVQQALDRVMKSRTTVMVAHRLSTIRNADIISVLEDGKIIEQGTHSSLVEKKNGAYYKLINLQQKQH